jgi:short subunit fatty acids transporter
VAFEEGDPGSLEKAVVSAWPVIILYHLYAGVAGLIQFTPIGEKLAGLAATVSTPYCLMFGPMCCVDFSFSLQMNSNSSVSTSSRAFVVAVHGFV